jgi:glyoxalase-like protein
MGAYLRLRQICLVAGALEPALDDLGAIFGLSICYRDGNVAKYGLVNALFAVGHSFLEVVAPTRDGTAAGRYLKRRGGDGGYMVILDCDDIERRRQRMATLGVRIANPLSYETYTGLQLHPQDTGGAMLEFNHTRGGASLDGPYHPAGPSWQSAVRTDVTASLVAAELQSAEPAALAERWSKLVERPVKLNDGALEIALDLGRLRFVAATDGRGEGLGGVDLEVRDRARILAAAQARGCAIAGNTVTVCGTRFRLLPAV